MTNLFHQLITLLAVSQVYSHESAHHHRHSSEELVVHPPIVHPVNPGGLTHQGLPGSLAGGLNNHGPVPQHGHAPASPHRAYKRSAEANGIWAGQGGRQGFVGRPGFGRGSFERENFGGWYLKNFF